MTRQQIFRLTIRELMAPVADLLFDDETVSEVLINGPNAIYCERKGKLELTGRSFKDPYQLDVAIRNIAQFVNRTVDDAHHSMDARFPSPDMFRVHVIVPPCSNFAREVADADGTLRLEKEGVPVISIRKFSKNRTSLDWLVNRGSLSAMAAEYLGLAVRLHRNLVVSGGTGAGKTSLLNALSAEVPAHERIVVIEDSSELQLQQPHTVYLEAKQAGPDGKGGVTIRDLFIDSLRMRPDRILVGEVRRGEALDLIQSMLSGHDGALSTVHASSARLALVRLETLCLMNDVGLPVYVARTQVGSAIHVIAQIARLADGSRRVVGISEVAGLTGPDTNRTYRIRPIFKFVQTGMTAKDEIVGELQWTGKRSRFATMARESKWSNGIRLTKEIWAGAGKKSEKS
jgi:pilus assembly protein CpaF